MRGKPRFFQRVRADSGITPADAGKTGEVWACTWDYGDHPRGCGENRLPVTWLSCGWGSPPRMRGKPLPAACVLSKCRITPADAGKTSRTSRKNILVWDHPRGCGENHNCNISVFRREGSPPRMRGKLGLCMHERFEKRITPADAGKTVIKPYSSAILWDHPRGCGENCSLTASDCWKTGSPPRMRGKPPADAEVVSASGITPADAGKTKISSEYQGWS